ncbi:MAG: appB [Firmicutes bacterium]|nr:appB [Bacillota bacterium]
MFQYLIRRLLIALPVLLGITLINFYIVNLAPGDAVDLMVNPGLTKVDLALKREQLGLNEPLHVRYVHWLGNVVKGDLGNSFADQRPVSQRIGERVGPTLALALTSLILAYLIAIPIGVISATKQYSWVDYGSTVLGLVGISVPSFFLALGAIYFFSLKLNWLPTGGMITIGGAGSGTLSDHLLHLIMPAVVLGLNSAGSVMRYTRSSMLDVLRQDYMRTARSKGLAERLVILKHGLRNAAIPIVTILSFQMTGILGGAIITEQIFQWPGMGRLVLEAISQRDYPVIMGINLLTAVMVVVFNLLTDAVYAVVDPRISYT